MVKEKISSRLSYILLGLGMLLILTPLYLLVITGLKTSKESSRNFFSLPSSLNFENFKTVLQSYDFLSFFLNSAIITIVSVALIIVFVPLAAYAISRNGHKFYYRALFIVFVLGIITPFQVIMLPITKLMSDLDMQNIVGLILLYLTYASTQGIFLYVGYIRTTIPRELEEAAYIDGASKLKTYFLIIFPLLKPMTATIVILNAFWIWNDFLLPLLILNKSKDLWTLPLFQYNFKSQYTFEYNLAFASYTLSIIPIMIIYFMFQKQIIAGLTGGAVKS